MLYETADEYKELAERKCVYQAHGGLSCDGASNREVWWVVTRDYVAFGEADSKCREVGGRLYFDVKAETFLEELARMFQKVPDNDFCPGINYLSNIRPLETA